MADNDFISIIIPVYNGSKYILPLVVSFTKQTYKNFELVFIDDGSIDNSYNIIFSLIDKYNLKIKVFQQKNGGVSSARNLGLEKASGDYICFCDVDDFYDDHYLEIMLSAIKINNVDVAVCRIKSIRYNKMTNLRSQKIGKNDFEIRSIDSFLNDFLFYREVPVHCCLMIKNNILKEFHLKFSEGYKYGEDNDFSWRLFVNIRSSVVLVKKQLYYYVWQKNSAMGNFDKTRFDTVRVYHLLEQYIKIVRPDFYILFRKYWIARSLWSTARQASVKMSYPDFIAFFSDYNLKESMIKLFTYKDFKVAVSSMIYYVSPYLFYRLLKLINYNIH